MRRASLLLHLATLSALSAFTGCSVSTPASTTAKVAAPTTVFVVRHAEKELTPGVTDPPLTALGAQRAQALRDTLARQAVRAVYSTSTIRTMSTAQPTAQARQLTPMPYDARQLAALATKIRRQHRGQTVLVVGHSNTILETVEAFGVARPEPSVMDNEYNHLLTVTIPADSTRPATVVARRYGPPNK